MYKFGLKGTKWLKGIHLFFACNWVGAGLTMILLGAYKNTLASGDEVYAMNLAIKLIDDFIIIPAANGALLTGIIYSLFTNWGFFKFHWITVKYIMTIGLILFGTFFLGPWVNGSVDIVNTERIGALTNATYQHFTQMNLYFGSLQVFLMVVVVFISIFKPWGKRKSNIQKTKNNVSAK